MGCMDDLRSAVAVCIRARAETADRGLCGLSLSNRCSRDAEEDRGKGGEILHVFSLYECWQ